METFSIHKKCFVICFVRLVLIWIIAYYMLILFHLLLAAQLMHLFNSHGATDVTGFGILGHAQNLAKQQENEVSFIIHNLPIMNKMAGVAKACGNMFGLLEGTSAETSGSVENLIISLNYCEKKTLNVLCVCRRSFNMPSP